MARRILARGTQLQRSDGAATPVWVKVAQAISMDGPNMSADITQLDDHDLPAGYLAKTKTALDGGTVTFELHFDPDEATHSEIITDFENMTEMEDYRLVVPGATKGLAFSGTVTGFNPSFPSNGPVTASCSIEVDGAVTVATF